MKLLNLNRYSLLNRLINAGIWYLLIIGLVQIISHDIYDFNITMPIRIWTFSFLFCTGLWGIIAERNFEKVDFRFGAGYLVLITFANIVVYQQGWVLEFFIVLASVLTLVSLRQIFYGQRIEYSEEIPKLLFTYLFTLIFVHNFGGEVALRQIVVFFALVLGQTVTLKLEKSEGDNNKTANYGPLVIFFGLMIFMAFILAVPLQLPILEAAVTVLLQVYNIIRPLLFYVFVAIAYLLYPLMLLLRGLFRMMGRELPEGMEMGEGPPQEVAETFDRQLRSFDFPVVEIILVVGSIFLGAYIIKRIVKGQSVTSDYLAEKREDLAAAKMLKNDLNNLWQDMQKKFSSKQGFHYDLGNPCQAIRYYYQQFLQEAEKELQRKPGVSAREYKEDLIYYRGWREEKFELERLTQLYEKARYKEESSEIEAEEARKIWQDLRTKITRKKKGQN